MKKDLSDLQVKLLEVEQVLMRGVSAFPMNRIVQDPPPTVYRVDRQKAMAGVTPESAKERAAVLLPSLSRIPVSHQPWLSVGQPDTRSAVGPEQFDSWGMRKLPSSTPVQPQVISPEDPKDLSSS